MKNKKVMFINIDKMKLDAVDTDCKYILFTSRYYSQIDIKKFKIKPIVICFNGSYGIDLENNKILFNNPLLKSDVSKILNYANNHNVNYEVLENENIIYSFKLCTNNYSRMLIIPSYFNEILKYTKTIYRIAPKSNKMYYNFVVSKNVSFITNLSNIIEYLHIKANNFIELEHISNLINENIDTIGYCMGYNSLNKFKINDVRGSIIYEN